MRWKKVVLSFSFLSPLSIYHQSFTFCLSSLLNKIQEEKRVHWISEGDCGRRERERCYQKRCYSFFACLLIVQVPLLSYFPLLSLSLMFLLKLLGIRYRQAGGDIGKGRSRCDRLLVRGVINIIEGFHPLQHYQVFPSPCTSLHPFYYLLLLI